MYDFIYINFFKGQNNYRNGEIISGCQGLRRSRGGKKMGVTKKAPREIFTVVETLCNFVVSISISWLCIVL